MFDEQIVEKPERPSSDTPDWWGGYEARFKIIDHETMKELEDDVPRLHRTSGRPLTIDISKHEFVGDAVVVDVDGFVCRAYSKRLIVAEKLRALCQQRPDAFPPRRRVARARDFFDIHQIMTSAAGADVLGTDFAALVHKVFDAKRVPIETAFRLEDDRAFHESDWRSVRDSVANVSTLAPFDSYFDFVLDLVDRELRSAISS